MSFLYAYLFIAMYITVYLFFRSEITKPYWLGVLKKIACGLGWLPIVIFIIGIVFLIRAVITDFEA